MLETISAALLVAAIAPFVLMFGIAMTAVVDLVLAWPLLWTWNHAMPPIFHLPAITYWQSFSLLIVATLLVKSQGVSNSSSSK